MMAKSRCLCECEQCGEDIYRDYPYYKDDDDNCFCSKECAIEYHAIREVEFDVEYADMAV